MLIIACLANAPKAFADYAPGRVVSLLCADESAPTFPGLPQDRHLMLYVNDESCAETLKNGAEKRARALIDFVRNWDGQGDILVHCNRGVSRSPAAAFIIACAMAPDISEAAILAGIRRAAPHADPCPLIVDFADDLLGRKGRMFDAVQDLAPPCTALTAPTVTIQLAA